ncbi:neutral zinc metallopeptidase [Nonomuraea sp. NPDC048882]|uniref:neutral zinc metallopeptidase n=1 Tax=unclassified Nonomuraea TaxID=2593643 RepID=UPI0033E9FF1A
MRIPRTALLAGALASVLLAGTAHAAASSSAPAFKAALAKNPIYKTGKLGYKTCDEPDVQSADLDEVRVYLEGVLDCLDAAWKPVVQRAGFTFGKPTLRLTGKAGVPTGCGKFPAGAQAVYCPTNRRITFLVEPGTVEEPNDLWLMVVLAHEYGHHVQRLTGMLGAMTRYNGKNAARVLDESRRIELQAECLSGTFVGSVWHSLGRKETDFTFIARRGGSGSVLSLLGIKGKDQAQQTHGSAKNIGAWLTRGYDTESAGGCNTFKAPKSQVS